MGNRAAPHVTEKKKIRKGKRRLVKDMEFRIIWH